MLRTKDVDFITLSLSFVFYHHPCAFCPTPFPTGKEGGYRTVAKTCFTSFSFNLWVSIYLSLSLLFLRVFLCALHDPLPFPFNLNFSHYSNLANFSQGLVWFSALSAPFVLVVSLLPDLLKIWTVESFRLAGLLRHTTRSFVVFLSHRPILQPTSEDQSFLSLHTYYRLGSIVSKVNS